MSANSHRGGSFYGDAAPYRSREGLSTRPVAGSDEIQLRIDPMDLDDEISGLHGQVRRLKHVAEEIGEEVRYQKDFLEQLMNLPNFIEYSPRGPFRVVHGIPFHFRLLCLLAPSPTERGPAKQMTMIKAQAGVKNNLRRLNKSIVQNGSNHIVHVVVFALVCFFVVYLWSKISRK